MNILFISSDNESDPSGWALINFNQQNIESVKDGKETYQAISSLISKGEEVYYDSNGYFIWNAITRVSDEQNLKLPNQIDKVIVINTDGN